MGNSYKEVLILVAGATPQIITETIYALSRKQPPVYPDAVYITTTTTGRKRIEDTLIKQGILKKLIQEYNIPTARANDRPFLKAVNYRGR